ncbi:MAG: hypothetical protein OEO77_08905 [Acidimicrobiia bacterium]|nr:hypothetical protein [Acidimicrobiia bacterium]
MNTLIIHGVATWFMVGLIWTIQLVHYPLFALVGGDRFVDYEQSHARRMGILLAVPATLEVATGAALIWSRPDSVSLAVVLAAGALLALIWIVTWFVQVPAHARLSMGFDSGTARALTRSNWLRTLAWSGRGLIVAIALLGA